MIRLVLCLAVLLSVAGCGVCQQDRNFGFSYCGPVIVP